MPSDRIYVNDRFEFPGHDPSAAQFIVWRYIDEPTGCARGRVTLMQDLGLATSQQHLTPAVARALAAALLEVAQEVEATGHRAD